MDRFVVYSIALVVAMSGGGVDASSSSGPPSLAVFGRRRYVSISGLSAIMDEIRTYGMPKHCSRQAIKRARDLEFDVTTTNSYGLVMRPVTIGADAKGKPQEFWYADPRATLHHMIRSSDKLKLFILETLRRCPSTPQTPWKIITYNDEVVAGNPLLRHNHRKAHVYYYSFHEFGIAALSSEFLWFTLTVAISDTVNAIDGYGCGMLCKTMMLEFAVFATEGFICDEIIIFARIDMFVADALALQSSLNVKAGGHMFCLNCRNVISQKAWNKAESNPQGLVPIFELDINKFESHTDTSLTDSMKHLQAQQPLLKKGEFEALETALGVNFAPHGVLLCDNIEFKLSWVSFDYQHVYLVNGIWNHETGQLLDMLKSEPPARKIRHVDIDNWFQPFIWPFKQGGKSTFAERPDKGGPVHASASEGLGCFLVLQAFLSVVVWGNASHRVKAACCSYYALCTVLVLLTMSARGTVTPDQLMDAMLNHLKLHKAAYGTSKWKPKMHWCLHLPRQLLLRTFLVACFTHERKHKEVKRYMKDRNNPNLSFEKGVLQDVLHMQSVVLKSDDHPFPSGTCLLQPRPARSDIAKLVRNQFNSTSEVNTSVSAKASNFTTVHVNDVVCVTWENDTILVGKVALLCSFDGIVVAGIQSWLPTPQRHVYSTNGPDYFVWLHDVVDVCIYRPGAGLAFVVPPRGVAT